MGLLFNKENKFKIKLESLLSDILTESAKLHDMSINDYFNYLVYKENYLHLATNSLQKEKKLQKYYEKYCDEKSEKDVWSTLFNL